MDIVCTIDEAKRWVESADRPALTLGNFDGLHRGHQAILGDLRAWAGELGAPVGVITFRNHPREVLGGKSPPMINGFEHRLLLLERLGVDVTIGLTFDEELARVSAEAFVRDLVAGALRARALQLGFDSRFGHRAAGTPESARAVGGTCGLPVRVSDAVRDERGEPISSTTIREAIECCRLDDARRMLGRRVSVYGRVVRGDRRGHALGFPTANLEPDAAVRPPRGVYATTTCLGRRLFPSVTNVGCRPTVAAGSDTLLVETHLLDFDEDLYGEAIEVNFVRKIRDEKAFANLDVLRERIGVDIEQAREILRREPSVPGPCPEDAPAS